MRFGTWLSGVARPFVPLTRPSDSGGMDVERMSGPVAPARMTADVLPDMETPSYQSDVKVEDLPF